MSFKPLRAVGDPKALAMSQGDKPRQGLASANVQPGCPPTLATLKAGLLFGCYRRADANDPDVYVAAAAAVLSEYPPEIVEFVCDPRTGLPRKLKWLPTIFEIGEACDAQVARAKLLVDLRESARRLTAIVNDPAASDAARAQAKARLDGGLGKYL